LGPVAPPLCPVGRPLAKLTTTAATHHQKNRKESDAHGTPIVRRASLPP